jgi:hypothetical protein
LNLNKYPNAPRLDALAPCWHNLWMFQSRSLFAAASVLALLATGAAEARDEERPLATAITDAIDSCADTSAIRFRPQDKRVLLEAGDFDSVSKAIVGRYPMVEQDGFSPQGVVLWRKPGIGWVYVALLVNPSKSSEVCFIGSFGADKFAMTPTLIAKYFGSDAAKN